MALPYGVTYVTNIKGAKGDRGFTGTFAAASAEAVPAGSPAEAIISGPEEAKSLHIKVPRGFPGLEAVPSDEAIAAFVAAVDSATSASLGEFDTARNSRINVRDFGAMGDGFADDTAAIQAAIAAITGATTCEQTLFFPAGKYRFTEPITDERHGFTIVGAGRAETVLEYRGAGYAIGRVDGHVGGFKNRWRLAQFKLDTQHAASGTTALRVDNLVRGEYYIDIDSRGPASTAIHLVGGEVGAGRATYFNEFLGQFVFGDVGVKFTGYANANKFLPNTIIEGTGVAVEALQGSNANNVDTNTFDGVTIQHSTAAPSNQVLINLGMDAGFATNVDYFKFNDCRFESFNGSQVNLYRNVIRTTFNNCSSSNNVAFTSSAARKSSVTGVDQVNRSAWFADRVEETYLVPSNTTLPGDGAWHVVDTPTYDRPEFAYRYHVDVEVQVALINQSSGDRIVEVEVSVGSVVRVATVYLPKGDDESNRWAFVPVKIRVRNHDSATYRPLVRVRTTSTAKNGVSFRAGSEVFSVAYRSE